VFAFLRLESLLVLVGDLDETKTTHYKISDEVLYPKTPSQEHAFPLDLQGQDLLGETGAMRSGRSYGGQPSDAALKLSLQAHLAKGLFRFRHRFASVSGTVMPRLWRRFIIQSTWIRRHTTLIEHSDYDLHQQK
jgi:hypothetical protein